MNYLLSQSELDDVIAERNEKARKDFHRVILAIYNKLLSDPVVVEYLKKYEVQYKIESGKLWVEIAKDTPGKNEVEPYYVPLNEVHKKIDTLQYHCYLFWFVKNCEKVFYDAYHLDYNSDADITSFLLDKVNRLG
jgi:hypothetical protein